MDELATFKAAVPLRAFAESIGYVLDRAKSCLRKDPPVYSLTRDSDRIIVTSGRNGFDIYACVHDQTDRGDLIAFVCSREGVNLGEARKLLRSFSGIEHPFPIRPEKKPTPLAIREPEPDRQKVAALWNSASWNPAHPYLVSRCIPVAVLADPRFADTFRCLLYTSPSPRDRTRSRMPSSA